MPARAHAAFADTSTSRGGWPRPATRLTLAATAAFDRPASRCWWKARRVGKTELARAVAQATGSGLVRLQRYEGAARLAPV